MKMKIAFLFLTATLVFTAGVSFASGESPGKTFTVKVIELPYTYEVPAITVQTLEFTAPAPEQLTLHRVTGYSVSVAAEHAPFLRMADRSHWRCRTSYYISPKVGMLSKGVTRINAPPNRLS